MKRIVVVEESEKYGERAAIHFEESEETALCGRTRAKFEESEEKVTCFRCIRKAQESGKLNEDEMNPVKIGLSWKI